MCRGSAQNKKKISEMEPWVNSGLRRPGDELRRPQKNTPGPGLRKGAETIVNKSLKTADSIEYCPNPEQQEN